MKLSTLAKRVATSIEKSPRKWGKGAMYTRTGRYCALGIAAQEITLSEYLKPGFHYGMPDDIADLNNLSPKDRAKVAQLNELNNQFWEYSYQGGLDEELTRYDELDIPEFNDHPKVNAKVVVKVFKDFSKWLRKQGL